MANVDEAKINREIIKLFDKAIAEGEWDKSLFLQSCGKTLRDLRDIFVRDLNLDQEAQEIASRALAEKMAERAGLIEVYISLYAAEGKNLKRWEQILMSLAGHSISRPIYKREQDLKDMIRAKENNTNDAYAAVFVAKEDIIAPHEGSAPMDRFGHELLILRHGAIRSERITRFVHISGNYDFDNGVLKKRQG